MPLDPAYKAGLARHETGQIGDRETNLSTAAQTENSPMPVYDVIDLVYEAAGL